MPFIELRGLRFYYETRGQGPRILHFNGSGGDLRKKPGLMDSPLSEHFEVLAHDQRGLGQTDRPDIAYTMTDYAEDADALLSELGWDRCHVMGVTHSWNPATGWTVTLNVMSGLFEDWDTWILGTSALGIDTILG